MRQTHFAINIIIGLCPSLQLAAIATIPCAGHGLRTEPQIHVALRLVRVSSFSPHKPGWPLARFGGSGGVCRTPDQREI